MSSPKNQCSEAAAAGWGPLRGYQPVGSGGTVAVTGRPWAVSPSVTGAWSPAGRRGAAAGAAAVTPAATATGAPAPALGGTALTVGTALTAAEPERVTYAVAVE
ncbi:hypothetical protein ACWEMW_02535 [Streptomyces sp. NPDC004684]